MPPDMLTSDPVLAQTQMARALQLAELGLFTTDPNPRVGCVLWRDGRVVGEGMHVPASRTPKSLPCERPETRHVVRPPT